MAVANNNGGYIPDDYITYDTVKVDNTGSFDKQDGSFTAPIGGTFLFLFNAQVRTATDARISVRINGSSKQYFYNDDVDNYGQLVAFWSLDLVLGDKVQIYNSYSSSINVASTQSLYFMGILIN